jgi:RsiW-degrading membrane proteinase PrsW (M82 family)
MSEDTANGDGANGDGSNGNAAENDAAKSDAVNDVVDHGDASTESSASIWSQFIARVKHDPWGALAAVGLVVSVVFVAVEFRYLTTLNNEWSVLVRNAFYGAWTIGLLMAATFSVRTFRVRHVLRSWLHGFFPVLAVVLILGRATEFISDSGNLRTAFIVPILEECIKLAPLLLIVATTWMGKTREPSITDFAISGFAIGAGFGLHEDGLWVRDVAGGFDGSWWGRLFPNFLNDDPFVVAHPGWTALVGLGVGFCWHFRQARFAWLIGAVPLAVATLDHVSINYRGDAATRLRSLVMEGRLAAWMLIGGLLLALLVDLNAKKKGSAGYPTRTVRDCLTRPRSAPVAVRLPLAMLLIAQLRAVNGDAYRRVRDLRAQDAIAVEPDVSADADGATTF